jgi:signal transduction histidine kinase
MLSLEKRLPRWARWSLYWGLWTVLGILNAASAVIDAAEDEPETPAWEPISWEMSSLYTIGVLYPLVALAATRFRFTRRNWLRMALLHAVLLVVFSLLHTSGMVAIRMAVYAWMDSRYVFGGGNYTRNLLYEFYKDITLYWTLVAVALAFDYHRRYHEHELQSAQLQGRLAEAQLQNLRGQLNPHFLFNTLNMISSRMYEDPAEADRMIARLSDLLRFSLRSSDEPEVALRTELEMLEIYLEIMKARFGDSIRVNVNVDRGLQNEMVPTWLLQPLVENAFRHGIAGQSDGGFIDIRASARNGTLTLAVRDNGPGLDGEPDAAMRKGLGLSNTAERLRQMYGTGQRMELRNIGTEDGGGLEVVIEIPSRSGR